MTAVSSLGTTPETRFVKIPWTPCFAVADISTRLWGASLAKISNDTNTAHGVLRTGLLVLRFAALGVALATIGSHFLSPGLARPHSRAHWAQRKAAWLSGRS